MIHLHNHSFFSLLDGLSSPEEIVLRAKELGHSAVCISDHASISSLPELMKYGKEHGVKPIIACEFYVVHDDDPNFGKKKEIRYHFMATAKNWDGVQCLFRKLTLANEQKFNGRPRLLYSQLFDLNNCFISLACAISLMTRDDYEDIVNKFKETYDNSFYLEIIHASFKMKDRRDKKEIKDNPIEMPDQARLVNSRCVEMHKKHNIMLAATHDAHFVTKDQAKAFEVLLCIQTRSKMSAPRDKRFFFGDDNIYMKSEMGVKSDLLSLEYIEEKIIDIAMQNTDLIAEKCNIEFPKFELHLPKPYKNEDDEEIFKRKIKEGYYKLGFDSYENRQKYRDRISYEVRVIKKLKLIRYFLIVEDLMVFCKKKGIGVGSARGSAGGSLVALCMGITRRIDPIKYGLYFERFLNEDRVSMADIDLDISSVRRNEAIQYLRDKYGHDKVAQIATFGYLSAKSAFRDVCSSYDFPSSLTNKMSKLIEGGVIKEDGKKVGKYNRVESFDHVHELVEFKKSNKELFNIIKILDGRVRNAGVHACGLVISSIPLKDLGAIENRKGGECICWDKKISEDVFQLLKLDCLGLKTVDINTKACNLISKNKECDFITDDIPLDDNETEDMIASGDTVGIFQFEGMNARRLLKESGSGTLETCSGISAANRPGTLNAKDENGVNATTHYIKRVNGSEEPDHFIPQFEEILKDSHSVLLYQEQIIKICTEVAGFSGTEADTFRKMVAKKMTMEEFEEHRNDFVVGCTRHSNLPIKKSNKIFDDFLESSFYLFNKSHSYGYAILSMESAYLKRHYPVEFFCTVLSYAGKEDKFQEYIKDSKRHNVDILYPDINKSSASEFTINDKKVLAPLNSIKGVGNVAADFIIQARPEDGFKSYEDFLNILTELKINGKINKRVKDILYRANTFKSLDYFVEDKRQRRNNLRELLGLFSPIPSINFKSGRRRNDTEYEELIQKAKECSKCSEFGGFVQPLGYKSPSIFVILGLSKFDSRLLQNDNTSWYFNHLKARLDVQKSAFYFTSDVKCSHCGIEKINIKSKCKTQCKAFLKREIEIIRPKLIINTVSWLAPFISGAKGLRFQEDFGNIHFNGDLDSNVINSPSPQWTNFSEEIRERYKKEIIPLLTSLKKDQG